MRRLILLSVLSLNIAGPVWADVPQVVTDIAPIEAIAGRVMAGVGTPSVLISAGASPHDYAMRPSEARSLASADLVVWVGPQLTPWLAGPLGSLASGTPKLVLLETSGTQLLELREGVAFATHDHGHDADHGEDHEEGHEGGHKEDHADDHDADHDIDHAADHDADHPIDPHAWLDPQNGAVWARALAQRLALMDPEHADQYLTNAEGLATELAALEAKLSATLAPHQSTPFIVLHDAFHYFEARFNVEAFAAVSDGEAATPGPARISALRAALQKSPVTCAFAEPQSSAALLQTATEGQGTQVVTLDPMGDASVPLANRYVESLRQMGRAIADCLGRS